MCVEIINNNMNSSMEFNQNKNHKKVSYCIKRLVKQFFKSAKKSQKQLINAQNLANTLKADSLESLESLENLRNADIESECTSLESFENDANERLSCEMEDFEYSDITSVPVHFVRTEHGTFFWTAIADIPADNDLIEPLCCSTNNQIAISQLNDRWAQA